MAKKVLHRHATAATPAELEKRVRRALQEERFQNALELGKQLVRQEPTPGREELLRTVYLARLRQLRLQGFIKDARSLLDHVLQLGHRDPAWVAQLAIEVAGCGDVQRALDMVRELQDGQAQAQVLAVAVDQALAQKAAGRTLLPDSLRSQFDLVLQGFAQLEAGQDEALKESLQGIGLQSPFLDWKLLLRGLQAYYQEDKERALDNWTRLKPDRLPVRLAAPLRFAIDPAYAQAQPPDTQAALRRQADRMQPSNLVQGLRSLQAAFTADTLPQALQRAESLVPQLRQEAPQLVSRLAACVQAAILRWGEQRDLQRFKRIFGTPPDDPQLDRLEALALEACDDLAQAHKYWQRYEQALAKHATNWPPGHAARARALVWLRMGTNAASIPDDSQLKDAPVWLKAMPGRPKALKPSAEECFQHALDLDPDFTEVHEELFEYYRSRHQHPKAIQAGRRLLERFPEHLPTLTALSEILLAEKQPAEAVDCLQRALKVNPLERKLRSLLSTAQTHLARSHAEASRFDDARAAYQAALASHEPMHRYPVLCKWAAGEFKAGNADQAEELIRQALADANMPLPVHYQMVIEAIRLKLKPPLKKRFEKDFADALEQPPTPTAAIAALETAMIHAVAQVKYTGQKTHEKKVLAWYDKAPLADFTEAQLLQAGQALGGLKDGKRIKKLADRGLRSFRNNPRFLLLEVDSLLLPKPARTAVWRVQTLLDQVRLAMEKLPAAEQQVVDQELQRRVALVARSELMGGPPLGMLQQIMGNMFDIPVDDDVDDGW